MDDKEFQALLDQLSSTRCYPATTLFLYHCDALPPKKKETVKAHLEKC